MISENLREQLLDKIRRASALDEFGHRTGDVDYWLDQYNSATNLVTEWDAEQWGFPQDWMLADRKKMVGQPIRGS